MCLIDIYKMPVTVSLGVVVAILAVTMIWSVRTAKPHAKPEAEV
jgi:tellurite resistance protein TerC